VTSQRSGILLLGCLTWAQATPVGAQAGDDPVSRTVAVMGTIASVSVWAAEEGDARDAVDAAIRELERVEALLSSWRDDTEVGRLNLAPIDSAMELSPELRVMLSDVAEWSEWSGAAFHPVVGALVDAWDLRGAGRVPSDAEIGRALEAAGDAGMRFDGAPGTVTRLRDGAWLDPGGFGKGAALRTAADTLRARGIGRARLDLGGQLLLMGDDTVTIGVAHPARRSEVAATLRVAHRSVATSGQSERSVEVDGQRLGHIIDPRSGRPVPAWGSVTVVASDALVADVLATAFYVLGPVRGMRMAESLTGVGVLFLEATGSGLQVSYNEAMTAFLGELPG